jgi:hypothetical protein
VRASLNQAHKLPIGMVLSPTARWGATPTSQERMENGSDCFGSVGVNQWRASSVSCVSSWFHACRTMQLCTNDHNNSSAIWQSVKPSRHSTKTCCVPFDSGQMNLFVNHP